MPELFPIIARRRWIFLAFLADLHLVLLQGPETLLGRFLFLSHVGIGLLWQPFVQPRRRVGLLGILVVLVCTASLAFFLNWGLLALWTMLLTGIAGGKVFLFPNRAERIFHLLALGYLTMVLLALVLPKSVAALNAADPLLDSLVLYATPAIFILMALLPADSNRMEDRAEIVDYVYGVLVFLLLAVMVLGSISFALMFKASYFQALLMILALTSGTLMLLGFLWDPRAGFGGLGSAVAQHVMSLGLPIEGWLEFLSGLARSEDDPERFLERACAELPNRLPGVVGGRWFGFSSQGEFGVQQGHRIVFQHDSPRIELLTSIMPGPALRWDYDLALRLLGEHYRGKWRAQELKRYSYVEAIHETGARLTHDVKNLLQSLETLCVAAQRETADSSPQFNALLRRQLPEITARLRQTLVKLSAPGREVEGGEPVAATTWLQSLSNRYQTDWIDFIAAVQADARIAPVMFTSVAENLLQNASEKRHACPWLHVSMRLFDTPAGAGLEVSDNGTDIPDVLAARLFRQQVPSENGLGVGLYHCAQLAKQHGYRLRLAENRNGCVCFRLEPAGNPDQFVTA